jgi:mono/diheme cytochrome c family protein
LRAVCQRAAATGVLTAVILMLQSSYAPADVLPPGGGDGSAGYRLASQWCRDCHAIEPSAVLIGKPAPDFVAIANLPSTTALALKVFLQSSHKTMPNYIIKPADADDLVAYILSLKRD